MVKKYSDIVIDLRKLDKEQIAAILQHKQIATPQDPLKQTLLHFMADARIVEVLEHPLVDKLRTMFNETPLHYLALQKKIEVLSHPSVDKVKDNGGGTPLHNIASQPSLSAKKVSLILKHPSIDKIKNNDGRAPLHYMAQNGFVTLSYLKERYPWFPFGRLKKVTEDLVDKIINTSNAEKFILSL